MRGLASSFLLLLVFLGCESGELHLTSIGGSDGGVERDSATGAAGGTGGSSSGGQFDQFGLGGESQLQFGTGGERGYKGEPCLLSGLCSEPCPQMNPDCRACTITEDCVGVFPLCDTERGQCVECLGADDCLGRYGGLFPYCSEQVCAQCLSDDDCGTQGHCDHGLCEFGTDPPPSTGGSSSF